MFANMCEFARGLFAYNYKLLYPQNVVSSENSDIVICSSNLLVIVRIELLIWVFRLQREKLCEVF